MMMKADDTHFSLCGISSSAMNFLSHLSSVTVHNSEFEISRARRARDCCATPRSLQAPAGRQGVIVPRSLRASHVSTHRNHAS